ncbi:MAG: phosphoribosylamine--glycine ligase [Candidatus Spechtbacterales bacterium]
MRILVVGSGAREHAIAWKCRQSKLVDMRFCAPANAGIEKIAQRVDIAADDIEGLVAFAKDKQIDLTIVGPEVPLTLGIVDRFEHEGLLILGPSKDAALIEGSKIFAKNMLEACGLSHTTAQFKLFAFPDNAKKYIEWYMRKFNLPLVIKANGLASGKGVVIAHTVEAGKAAVDRLMVQDGHRLILIEEKLEGWECSFTVLTDGHNILPFPVSRDYKQDLLGNNTGGMGAYSPVPTLGDKHYREILGYIRQVLEALRKMGRPYKGFLYAGMMITKDGPKFLEFNCRLGDPEAQVILPLLRTDFVKLCYFAAQGNQNKIGGVEWSQDAVVNVVVAVEGYPGKYRKGLKIYGVHEALDEGAIVLHGGTKHAKNDIFTLLTDGGRALSVLAKAKPLAEAREIAYRGVRHISFGNKDPKKGKQWYREDIALDA